MGFEDDEDEEDEDEEDVQWSVDVSEEAVKARAKDLPEDLKRTLVIDGGDDDDEEGGPVREDAQEI